jgi:hypothetical protein
MRPKNKPLFPISFLVACLFMVFFPPALLSGAASVKSAEKITIGALEEVIILPWRVKLLARIDTGAATSSVGAWKIKIRSNMAEFTLRKEYGGMKLKLPIVEWRTFLSSEGNELRPVVEMEICLGPKRFRTQVSLNDRSRVAYPFLVGRRALKKGGFIVDVARTELVSPNCPGAQVR